MAIFKLTSVDKRLAVVVRAKCLSCAREVAVRSAGDEGTLVWRDPTRSTVELIRPDDKPGPILKTRSDA